MRWMQTPSTQIIGADAPALHRKSVGMQVLKIARLIG
jgi:hypothetical protein